MYIVKCNGRTEPIKFDKITARILKMCYGLDPCISAEKIAKKVISKLYNGISTIELDYLSSQIAYSYASYHPDYALVASRLFTIHIHQQIPDVFSDFIDNLHNQSELYISTHKACISEDIYEIVGDNKNILNETIDSDRDFRYDYVQLHYFLDHCLLTNGQQVLESPQYMFMRISIGIHKHDLNKVLDTYNALSMGRMNLHPPTLTQYGLHNPFIISQFISSVKTGQLYDIYKAINVHIKTKSISSTLSLSLHDTTTKTTSLLDLLRSSVNYINTTSTNEKSTIVYIEPWHIGIESFLEYINKQQSLEKTFRFALWIPDLFFQRINENGLWTLFSPEKCSKLSTVHNKEFVNLYLQYETDEKDKKIINARELWQIIIRTQLNMGIPYLFYKDRVNTTFNQQHIHTIQLSDWSGSLMLGSSIDENISCATASVTLSKFVSSKQQFDYQSLFDTVYLLTLNLNKIIDNNHYPDDSYMRFNLRHRPIGIGVSSLHDTYLLMEYPFESIDAQDLNRSIFETIYFAALRASNDLAKQDGAYSSFNGSLLSRGVFQFELWDFPRQHRWDWETLKTNIIEYGVRNSVLVSINLQNGENQNTLYNSGTSPRLSNINQTKYSEHGYVIDKILIRHLIKHKQWTKEIRQKIIDNNGSVQNISELNPLTKDLFKTAFELNQYKIIDQHVERGGYICQSDPLLLSILETDAQLLSDLQLYAWKRGLKTGMCQLRIQR